jgi:MOSC domain-containing protein YiiM
MVAVERFELVEQKGIRGNPRKFPMRSRTGAPSKRQVTLIEREVIAEHATALGIGEILPGAVRSNIETEGIRLGDCLGRKVRVGSAVLLFCEPRTPCEKMDRVSSGLRELMEDARQGVLAQVLESGVVKVGDTIEPFP